MINDSGDILTECPYDATHIVTTRCLCKHLIKCRENHKGHRKVACKFDKTHLVPGPELPHHLSVCPMRYLLDRELQLKAAANEKSALSGNVRGPQIVNKYMDHDDEDWGSESNYEAPVAFFNRNEMDYKEGYKNDKPFIVSDESYQNIRFGNAHSSLGENTCRKLPVTSSKAAKIAEPSGKPAEPIKCSQVYLFSIAQTANKGWGRGKGVSPNQAVNNVGVRSVAQTSVYSQGPVVASGNSHKRNILQASGEYDPELPGRDSDIRHSSQVQILRHQSPQGNTFTQEQRHNQLLRSHPSHERLQGQMFDVEQTYESSDVLASVKNPSAEIHKNFPSLQDTVTHVYQSQPEAPKLPKGRGYVNGFERLRPPASSSYAEAINSQLNSWQISSPVSETRTTRRDDENISVTKSSTDYPQYTNEDLRKIKRKLEKKLKQIMSLEQKLSNGLKLTEEEESKLKKKNEILNLTEKISKLL